MNIDDAMEHLREAVRADVLDEIREDYDRLLPDTDAEPSYDKDHNGTELSIGFIEKDEREGAEVLHIELYERYDDGTYTDVAVHLDIDDARRVHATLTAILKQANAC